MLNLHMPESPADMPAAFQAADETSLRGQRRAVLRTGSYLALLVVAALGA